MTPTRKDFAALLVEFREAERGTDWNDVPCGRAFARDGRVNFQLRALQSFLARRGVEMGARELTASIRAMGGGSGQKTLRGNRHFNFWRVPSDVLLRPDPDREFTPDKPTEAEE